MNKISIDPSILAEALTKAISAAISVAVCSDTKPIIEKKKRGRPAKTKVVDQPNVELIQADQEDLELINELDLPVLPDKKSKAKPSYLFNAKSDKVSGDKRYGITEDVTINRPPMKFMEVGGVPHEKQDWEPTERRDPVKMMVFDCCKCGRKFEAYPSTVPQAFFKVSGSEGHQDGAGVMCNKCGVK